MHFQYSEASAVRTLRQIGVLQKILRKGSVSAKELAADVWKNENVLLRFPTRQI